MPRATTARVLALACSASALPSPKKAPRAPRLATPRGVATRGGDAPKAAIDVLPPLLAASAITATLTYPLDFLRAARMSSAASADAAKLGLRAAVAKFSQGLAPEVAKGTLSRVLKFGGFPVAHRLLYDRAPAAGSAASRAAEEQARPRSNRAPLRSAEVPLLFFPPAAPLSPRRVRRGSCCACGRRSGPSV